MTNEDKNLYDLASGLYKSEYMNCFKAKADLSKMGNTDLSPQSLATKQKLNRIIDISKKRMEKYKEVADSIEEKYFGKFESYEEKDGTI